MREKKDVSTFLVVTFALCRTCSCRRRLLFQSLTLTSLVCFDLTGFFCWRHRKNPVGKEWRRKTDDSTHVSMIKEAKGIRGVRMDRWQEAHTVRHCALSLVLRANHVSENRRASERSMHRLRRFGCPGSAYRRSSYSGVVKGWNSVEVEGYKKLIALLVTFLSLKSNASSFVASRMHQTSK